MKVLAADTTTTVNAVALCDDHGVLAETIAQAGRKHSERLLATVDWVLKESGNTLANIDLLAVSIGPGSFTGLRIGVSAWKGLALGAGLPLVGVPTLDAMARLPSLSDGLVCPLLDAKMNEVYAAAYRVDGDLREKLCDDFVGPVESFLEIVEGDATFLGDGATLYRDTIRRSIPRARFVQGHNNVPRASTVAQEALALARAGAPTDPAIVNPVYLRMSQAEEARKADTAKALSP